MLIIFPCKKKVNKPNLNCVTSMSMQIDAVTKEDENNIYKIASLSAIGFIDGLRIFDRCQSFLTAILFLQFHI